MYHRVMEQSNLSPRMYLDLDGVVFPLTPLSRARGVDHDGIDKLHDHEWWRKSITDRIGQLGIEVVISSSWGEAFMGGVLHSPRESLGVARALPVDLRTSKVEAIYNDLLERPAPYVVIDDDITGTWKERLSSLDTPGIFVVPNGQQGLTDGELDMIEQWLQRETQ